MTNAVTSIISSKCSMEKDADSPKSESESPKKSRSYFDLTFARNSAPSHLSITVATNIVITTSVMPMMMVARYGSMVLFAAWNMFTV